MTWVQAINNNNGKIDKNDDDDDEDDIKSNGVMRLNDMCMRQKIAFAITGYFYFFPGISILSQSEMFLCCEHK